MKKNELKNIIKLPKIRMTVKYSGPEMSELYQVNDPQKIYQLFNRVYNQDLVNWIEEFYALYLNNQNRIIGSYLVSRGGTNMTSCDPKVVFTTALLCGATGIILSHNHPSGEIKPSPADLALTKKMVTIADQLTMKIHDHIIYSPKGIFSFAEEGLL